MSNNAAPQSFQPMPDALRRHIADYLAAREPDHDGDIVAIFTAGQRDAFVEILNSHATLKARVEELEAALRECRTSYCGYAVTDPKQYPTVLADFWKELSRIDKTSRAAMEIKP